MKIVRKTVFVTLTHDVTIGDLSATLEGQVWLTDSNSQDFDIEFADITNIKYRGVDISGYDNWSKFKKFHMDMGINYSEILDQEFEKIFTKEAISKLVKKENLKF